MRIGLIAPPWIPVPPPAYGGIESIVDVLARGLAAAGNEVLLAAAAGSTCPVPKVPGAPAADPATMGACADELRHSVFAYEAMDGVDLVHDHTLAGPLYRHRPEKTPLITTAHGPLTGGLRGIYHAMTAEASLIAISHHQARSAPDLRISRVIHHGINTGAVPVGRGEGGYACFLGRMHPGKGLPQAIGAARLARMPLRIAAKMHNRAEHEYFRTVIVPLLGPDVEYLGELNTADKYALLGGAVALLNPIQWAEPFGMVMIEALAADTPGLRPGNHRRRRNRLPARRNPRTRGSPQRGGNAGPPRMPACGSNTLQRPTNGLRTPSALRGGSHRRSGPGRRPRTAGRKLPRLNRKVRR